MRQKNIGKTQVGSLMQADEHQIGQPESQNMQEQAEQSDAEQRPIFARDRSGSIKTFTF